MIRLLTFTTLYPNATASGHGIFVETRLRQLLRSGAASASVVAPVPWFPSTNARFGDYARFAAVPARERRHGIDVEHPRYLLLPRIGMSLAPGSLARCAISTVRRLVAQGLEFDLIDAHYFYPDGVAAILLGEALGKPVVVTARGSDINLIAQLPGPRRKIIDAARRCAAVVTVCQALKDSMVALGADASHVTVLRNGVDLEAFHPEPREEARGAFGLSRFTLVSVGNLLELKGHDLCIRAVAEMPDTELLIAGGGPEEARLRAMAETLGVGNRVRLLGRLPQERLRTLYSAADALVLASSREGWANVLLESMACGTPVVATDVGGSREVITAPEAGTLIAERSPSGIKAGVSALRGCMPDRSDTRRFAERFGWEETTKGQLDLFRSVLRRPREARVEVAHA